MSKTNRTKLLLDLGAFAAFLVVMDPRSSGIAIHEWLAAALGGTIIVHLLLNWNWLVEMTKRVFTKSLNGARTNYILNWLLFMDGILIMISGIMISESLVPALGLSLPQDFAWGSLHDLSANISLLLMGIHITLHWSWIVNTFKRLLGLNTPKPVTALALNGKQVKA